MKVHVSLPSELVGSFLEASGKTIDEDGMLVDSDGSTVLSRSGTEMSVDDFGIVELGSEIFVRNNLFDLIDYFENE
jgi:hypothetical protein